jgi:hypothetical protein
MHKPMMKRTKSREIFKIIRATVTYGPDVMKVDPTIRSAAMAIVVLMNTYAAVPSI